MQQYTYKGTGLAEQYENPGMADLDLAPGTQVALIEHDQERNLALIEWVDGQGNPRITSVDPDVFADQFVKGTNAD